MTNELKLEFFNLHFGELENDKIDIPAIKECINKMNISKLYKYRAGTKMDIENLKKNVLIASKPEKFNDVFEFYYKLNIDDFKLFELTLNSDIPIEEKFKDINILCDETKEKLDANIKNYNVCCLSENRDSLLMWAHYANEHKGFSIEYDFYQVLKKNYMELQPVLYSDKVVDYGGENTTLRQLGKIICTKSLEWSYENEWRIYREMKNVHEEILMPKPSAIYLGCNASEELKEELKEHCSKEGIVLYKAIKNKMKYKLDFIKIDL